MEEFFSVLTPSFGYMQTRAKIAAQHGWILVSIAKFSRGTLHRERCEKDINPSALRTNMKKLGVAKLSCG